MYQKKQSYNKNEDHSKGNKVVDRSFVCAFSCKLCCLLEKKYVDISCCKCEHLYESLGLYKIHNTSV